MIERLSIQNLILIEKSDIHFGPGLNIITGETGAGKSAILTAIRLILGERADVQWIRNGADLAIVEATVWATVEIDGLNLPSPFIIRRELHRSGRSRCFVEDQQITLQQLRTIPISLIDQSASLKLNDPQIQRQLLDTYTDLPTFSPHFEALCSAKKDLDDLLALQKTSEVQIARMEEDLQFIEEINWKEGEEIALQADHHLLTHASELVEKASSVTTLLSEGSHPLLSALKRSCHQIEALTKIEPKFQDCADWLKTATLNLEEASHFLTSYISSVEVDPNRLVAIEERIGEIESVKRRFGSFDQVEQIKHSLKSQTGKLLNLEEEIKHAKKTLDEVETEVKAIAETRTATRKKGAAALCSLIMEELHSLNLPDARFAITIQPRTLAEHGADEIRYLFAANPGQPLGALDECASGGELSRVLFALKTALGDKEKATCLIFDEIDSNIGGKTAAILGAKLEKLAKQRQLICVTHFIQVAKHAADHFSVSKKTRGSEAVTEVEKLLAKEAKEAEYARMTGAFD